MDPKLSNLDPKLQDAYNRVMNGTGGYSAPQQPNQSNQTPPPQQPQQQSPSNSPVPPPANPAPGATSISGFGANTLPNNPNYANQNPTPVAPTPPTHNNAANNLNESIPVGNSAPIMPNSSSTIAFNAENSSKNIGTTPVKKEGTHMLPFIVGIVILILLVAYAFIWIMIFNVDVPFVPKF
jgi:hypothetical protein